MADSVSQVPVKLRPSMYSGTFQSSGPFSDHMDEVALVSYCFTLHNTTGVRQRQGDL